MQRYRKRISLPYPPASLFDLVLDVERYPEFLPAWRKVEVVDRGEGALTVRQRLAIGPLRWQFVSQARFSRPDRITIEAADGPFRHLLLDWRFTAEPAGCTVELDVECALRSNVLERLGKTMTPALTDGIIVAFERRARERLDSVSR